MGSRTLRIGIDVHVVGRRVTGNETYALNLVGALSELPAHDVEFVYYHTGAADLPAWPGETRVLRPHLAPVRIPVGFPLALARDGVGVAHFQYVAPPLCPCPTVVTVHDITYEQQPEWFPWVQRQWMKRLIPLSVRRAAHVLTPSEYTKRQIVERYHVAPERISVTPLAVSSWMRPPGQGDDPRRELARLGLPEPFILAVGNLNPRKNLERLMRAYASLRQQGSIPHQLVLAGQKAHKGDAILGMAESLGVGPWVSATGYVSREELRSLYGLAEIFVYPSLAEGFGLPILEAMACGTPVVASASTCMPEVAGDAALLVDPLDEGAIAAAIRRLVEDPELRRELRWRGLARASGYAWRTTAERTLEIYRRCA
jgi:glycosyltransferase involved in cell wall biosynthesis